jgi:hypothetical protein
MGNHGKRSHLVTMLFTLLESMSLKKWDEIMRIVQGVLWAEDDVVGSDRLICDQVMRAMNHSSMAYSLSEAGPALIE